MAIRWKQYPTGEFFDELIGTSGRPRGHAKPLCKYFTSLKDSELEHRRTASELAIRSMGITFSVYSEQENGLIDRAWPFDIIPRIIAKKDWLDIETGLKQRVLALNLFIDDLYHQQKIIKDGIIPAELIAGSQNFREECVNVNPPLKIWAHICGTDLVRDKDGTLYVLEDNLRVPSGVSYMLENRQIMKRVFPELFEHYTIDPVTEYPARLYDTLAALSPRRDVKPEIVVLTPGIYNSAYFEHSYLAQQMGVELVQGQDLKVGDDDRVYMRTVEGHTQVDVIYRRIDDGFLDPEVFNPNSMLGVSGLMRAWKKGTVALVNAPGAGVADDKVIYAFVPQIIKYYLDEEAKIPNVPTHLCMDKQQRQYVLENLDKLVVKPANESGGYGMLIGPHSTKSEREQFARLIRQNPRNYIAQPMLTLSTAPTLVGTMAKPRHLDLRPFIISAENIYVTTGGLTRVALKEGSMVVNSSQGGGSKDTWVVDLEKK